MDRFTEVAKLVSEIKDDLSLDICFTKINQKSAKTNQNSKYIFRRFRFPPKKRANILEIDELCVFFSDFNVFKAVHFILKQI